MSPIEIMIRDAADVAASLDLISRPATFRRELDVRAKRAEKCGLTCSGGLAKKPGPKSLEAIPVIKLGSSWLRWKWDSDTGPFYEYASIARDPEIGSMMSKGHGTEQRCLALHELARAIVWWNWYCDGRPIDNRPTGHGGTWRRCYRQLRKHYGLVNALPPKKARPRRATTAGLHLAGSGRGSNLNSMEKHYDER